MLLVPHEDPREMGMRLVPYDVRDGQSVSVHGGHGHEDDLETIWEPTFRQTRIPAPGSSKMPVAPLHGASLMKKNGRGKTLAGLQKEPW